MNEWTEYSKPVTGKPKDMLPAITLCRAGKTCGISFRANRALLDRLGVDGTVGYRIYINESKATLGITFGDTKAPYKAKRGVFGMPLSVLNQIFREKGIQFPDDVKMIPAILPDNIDQDKSPVVAFKLGAWWK